MKIKDRYEFKRIDFNIDVIKFISSNHYSETCPRNTQYAFGLFEKEKLIGVCLFGPFTRLQSQQKYKECLELTRLFIYDGTPKNTESYFIGSCLRWLKKNTPLGGIISYADPTVGHSGVIYQATNFSLISKTNPSYHYINKEGNRVHKKQVWDRAKSNNIQEQKQAKNEGLKKKNELSKYTYFYPLRNGFEISKTNHSSRAELEIYRYNFFNKWTRESAWVYGLILGDGFIFQSNSSNRIGLCGNKDTILKFEKILRIKNKNQFKSGVHHSYIDSRRIVQWFEKRGYLGKKSDKLIWPTDIPKEFMWDFVRGLIDTDGSFRFDNPQNNNRRGREKLNLGFGSNTKDFCRSFIEFLNVKNKITENKKSINNKIYINYTFKLGFEKSIEVLEKIYDCPQRIRNEERYNKYLKGKKLLEQYNSGCIKCGKKIHTKNLCMEHMWENKLKDKPQVFCFCGERAVVAKKALCTKHYHQYRRGTLIKP